MTTRNIVDKWQAMSASDGAGVKLRRALGFNRTNRMDPYLMLDAFSSDNPDDYIAGFPAHPHRGFETVTYIVDGHMQHKDHMGNQGDLQAGGVQWMVAGKGIIHEEMPQQKDGLLRGFQLWLNLPAAEKMQAASYRDIPSEEMPWQPIGTNTKIKLIAGKLQGNKIIPDESRVTQPIIADLDLSENTNVTIEVPSNHSALIYVFEGNLTLDNTSLNSFDIAILSEGNQIELSSSTGARAMLITGAPINEPIVQHGPFVMNTDEEIMQAIDDYRNGLLTA